MFTDGVTAGAIYFTSPLSLPFVLEQLVPALRVDARRRRPRHHRRHRRLIPGWADRPAPEVCGRHSYRNRQGVCSKLLPDLLRQTFGPRTPKCLPQTSWRGSGAAAGGGGEADRVDRAGAGAAEDRRHLGQRPAGVVQVVDQQAGPRRWSADHGEHAADVLLLVVAVLQRLLRRPFVDADDACRRRAARSRRRDGRRSRRSDRRAPTAPT